MMTNQICWNSLIETEKKNKYFQDALAFVEHERAQGKVIFPAGEDVFSAFSSTKFDQVKVVILGQDPYHGPNQAHGLCFSVLPGIKTPPSLVNIFKELEKDVQGFQIPQHGYLQSWAEQGVLMLNTVLTVEQGKAHSHAKCGWETFTDKMIEALNQYRSDVVFILWGAHAQKKGRFIDRDKHYVLIAPHPSPLSAHRGFFGCQHFSKTNELLASNGIEMIDWNLPLTTK